MIIFGKSVKLKIIKKQLLLCALIIAMTPELFSQTLTSKRGHVILPEQGDFAIGVDCYFGIKDRFEGVENGKNANKESPIVGNGVRFGSATPASLRVMFYF